MPEIATLGTDRKFHRQVSAHAPWGEVEVDEKIEPILRELWTVGVRTNYSCQGGWMQERAWSEPYFTSAYIAYPAEFDTVLKVVLLRLQVGRLKFEREDLVPDRNQWSVRFPAVGR